MDLVAELSLNVELIGLLQQGRRYLEGQLREIIGPRCLVQFGGTKQYQLFQRFWHIAQKIGHIWGIIVVHIHRQFSEVHRS